MKILLLAFLLLLQVACADDTASTPATADTTTDTSTAPRDAASSPDVALPDASTPDTDLDAEQADLPIDTNAPDSSQESDTDTPDLTEPDADDPGDAEPADVDPIDVSDDTSLSDADGPDTIEDDATLDADEADVATDTPGDVTADTPGDVADDTSGDVAADVEEDIPDIPEDTPEPPNFNIIPCEAPEYWPGMLQSQTRPIVVHYQRAGDRDEAQEVLELLEHSWDVQVDELGFRPPLPDDGQCGPNEDFDAFLWRDYLEAAVDLVAANPDTPWEDYSTYMIIDPWGPYGGDLLGVTATHEFNHACQAADDWWDTLIVYEMTANFIEDIVFDDVNDYHSLLEDFQSRPARSIDWSDNYRTWYMYAASLYLHFLRDRYFEGDPRFVADMWLEMRNSPGAADDPELNEPDFQDALDIILQDAAGVGFYDSIVTFARWRWYTGERDDGRHFEEGAEFPPSAMVSLVDTVPAEEGAIELSPRPMLLGSAYLEVVAMAGNPGSIRVDLAPEAPDAARWVVQAVPGLDGASDGEVLDLSSGPVLVQLDADGTRTLIFTALPVERYDPDERRAGARYRADVVLSLP